LEAQVSIVSVIASGDMVAVEAQATAQSIVGKVDVVIRAGHRVAVTVGAVVDGDFGQSAMSERRIRRTSPAARVISTSQRECR
jgi:hypothetical protein